MSGCERHGRDRQGVADVDYWGFEQAIGGEDEDHDFFWQLRMARGAVAIRRKALLADAATATIADPNNPYTALRKFLDVQVHQLEEAERAALDITKRLTEVELKGGWSIPKAVKKQDRIRKLAAAPVAESDVELLFLRTANGEILQVISGAEDDAPPSGTASH